MVYSLNAANCDPKSVLLFSSLLWLFSVVFDVNIDFVASKKPKVAVSDGCLNAASLQVLFGGQLVCFVSRLAATCKMNVWREREREEEKFTFGCEKVNPKAKVASFLLFLCGTFKVLLNVVEESYLIWLELCSLWLWLSSVHFDSVWFGLVWWLFWLKLAGRKERTRPTAHLPSILGGNDNLSHTQCEDFAASCLFGNFALPTSSSPAFSLSLSRSRFLVQSCLNFVDFTRECDFQLTCQQHNNNRF